MTCRQHVDGRCTNGCASGSHTQAAVHVLPSGHVDACYTGRFKGCWVDHCMQVISALAESSMAGRSASEPPLHIPYRDSKLTKLLMDSLVSASSVRLLAAYRV